MKTALITGCSSGIGFSCAITLKNNGWTVFATARDAADVERLKHAGLEAVQLDVSSSDSIVMALNWIFQKTNYQLSLLINNAAFAIPGAIEDLSRSALVNQFETGLFGMHELCTAVLPIMRRQAYGKIIQISSVLGLVSMPYRGAYSAMKYALEGWTDALRQELRGSGIAVSLIEPGPISSAFRENAYNQFQYWVKTEDSNYKHVYVTMEQRFKSDSKAPFALPAQAVADKIAMIVEMDKPKPRYYITKATWYFAVLKRLLSTRMLDYVVAKIGKYENQYYQKLQSKEAKKNIK